MGFRRMRDKTFVVCGMQDWLQNSAGYDIQIEQTSFRMRVRTKQQLQDAGNGLIFSQYTESIHPYPGTLICM